MREAIDSVLRSYAEEVAEGATDELRREAATEFAQLRDALRTQELARIDAEAQLAEARRLLDEVKQGVEGELADARAAHEAALSAERQRADTDIDDARRMAQAQIDDMARTVDVRIAALRQHLDASERLVAQGRLLRDALRSIDDAGSLSGVLEQVAHWASSVADRVALLVAKTDGLHAWRFLGFDSDLLPSEAALPPEHLGLAGLAARERRPIVLGSSDAVEVTLPVFAVTNDERTVAAFPIVVAGDVVAVVYADAVPQDDDTPPAWCPWLETLTTYAGRTLETLTVQLAMGFGSGLVRPSHSPARRPLSGSVE